MLAAMKLGLVLIPAMPTLGHADIADRLERGQAKYLIAHGADAEKFAGLGEGVERVAVGPAPPGWRALRHASRQPVLRPRRPDQSRRPDAALFHLGHDGALEARGAHPCELPDRASLDHVRARPQARRRASQHFLARLGQARLVELLRALERRRDRHRARQRFEPRAALDVLVEHQVTTFCAPPTVWRMLIQHDLTQWKVVLREVNAAGEPVNPEIIEQVRRAWGLTLRDSYGQTETTMMIGNSPGQTVVPGSMGRPLPGYRVALIDADGLESDTGEIALPLRPRPAGLMRGYQNERGELMPIEGEYYRTGDVASRDADGYITFIGRADDVFKSSDYRLSPFELESVLIEHAGGRGGRRRAGARSGALHDRQRLYRARAGPCRRTARRRRRSSSTCAHALSAYKLVRRIEFFELPKTVSGKIRRVELRQRESALAERGERAEAEFRIEDFPEG